MRKSIAVWLFLAGMTFMGQGFALGQGMPDGSGMALAGGGVRQQLPLDRALGLPGQPGRWWVQPRVVEYLKLTEDEQKALDGILLEHRERLIDLRAALQKADLQLETLVGKEKPEEKSILVQIDHVAQARAELEKANARYLLAIWSTLTPAQRKLTKEFRANHEIRYQGGWGRDQGPQRNGQPVGSEVSPARQTPSPDAK